MSGNQSYIQQKERLEEIVLQIRSKEIPLEKSLDLYDEALAIGTHCVEQLEKTDFTSVELESVADNPKVEFSGKIGGGSVELSGSPEAKPGSEEAE